MICWAFGTWQAKLTQPSFEKVDEDVGQPDAIGQLMTRAMNDMGAGVV